MYDSYHFLDFKQFPEHVAKPSHDIGQCTLINVHSKSVDLAKRLLGSDIWAWARLDPDCCQTRQLVVYPSAHLHMVCPGGQFLRLCR